MEYERWEEDIFDFEFDGRGYRFEPEYTVEELRQMDLEMQARDTGEPEEVTEGIEVPRVSGSWWCTCGKCKPMPTELESRCCKEWDLLVTSGMASLNVSVDETGEEDEERGESPSCITEKEVRQLLNKPVLETFFWVPKINWKKRPVPEGPNGQLSER